MTASDVVVVDPEIQAGTPCFKGTRVPVKSLFSAMLHGRTIDYFIESFPTVTRQQAEAVLRDAGKLIEEGSVRGSNAA